MKIKKEIITTKIPDELDKKIIDELYKNPFQSFEEIAKTLDTTHQTVANRIKRLIEEDMLEWTFSTRIKKETKNREIEAKDNTK